MKNLIKRHLEHEKNLASSKSLIRAAVSAKIKKDFRGYELPEDARIKVEPTGKIHVSWRDLKALSYGFFHDGDGGIDHHLTPEDF